MPVDSFRRQIEYLRLSVTDLCNIRCLYCIPPEGVAKNPRSSILTFEEIVRLMRILAGLGIRRVRLTGGEPLVRRGIPDLVRRLNETGGIGEVLLTTNGLLLKPLAEELHQAGLRKINIHLDTLSPGKFREITRWGDIRQVLEGIDEARRVGFSPIKLNAVIQRGVNDDEVEDLLRFAAEQGLILRLIELMPIGPAREMRTERYISLDEIKRRLQRKYTLTPSIRNVGCGPAVYYKVAELDAPVGFISPVSRPFCQNCNRIRISSDGRFQDCLAFDGTFSFRDLLRDPAVSDETIAGKVKDLVTGKRESHEGFVQGEEIRTPCMYGIGG